MVLHVNESANSTLLIEAWSVQAEVIARESGIKPGQSGLSPVEAQMPSQQFFNPIHPRRSSLFAQHRQPQLFTMISLEGFSLSPFED